MSHRWRVCAALLSLLTAGFVPALTAQSHRLNLFIWSEYIDPQIVADFEKAHDCKVTLDLYEDEASMMAKLQGGGASLYDVVVPPNQAVPAMMKLELLRPLRHANIPNLRNLAPKFRSPPYDPGGRHTVAYQWGTVGLFVRRTAEKKFTETWGLIFDPALQPGPFILMDSDRDMIGCALKHLGHKLNSTDPAQLKAARNLLLGAKSRSLGFAGGVGGKNKVLAREAVAAVVYSGDAVRGMKADPGTYYFIPREGSQIWVDSLAIPAQAPHPDVAEKFLNYLLDARVGARLARFTQFASPNEAAWPHLPQADLANPAIYPPPEIMTRLEFLENLGGKNRLYDEIWTQVKSR